MSRTAPDRRTLDSRPLGPKALLFDLDGTLYPKLRLRATMLAELATVPLFSGGWREARATWRGVSGFRRVREGLRALGDGQPDLGQAQYRLAAAVLSMRADALEALIDSWIHQRPLRHLRRAARPGLPQLLARLRTRGLKLGVFSDYPAEDKLAAMGILEAFDLVLDAEDLDISALKPHPKGLLKAAATWGLAPSEVTYIGDRPEVDAQAALFAGMPCLLIGAGEPAGESSWQAIRRLTDIERLLDHGPWPKAPTLE